ncbi:retrovirus-related pol polyprotein from transposon TNT 1-94 [Tanacetum coccineum]
MASTRGNNRLGVVRPEIGNDIDFEIKSQFMKKLRLKLFAGTRDEDAHKHVQRVLEITDIFHIPGATHDAVLLRVFPVTLTGRKYKFGLEDIRNLLNAEAEVVHIILTRIDNDIYTMVDACPNAIEMWKSIKRLKQAATRNRDKAIVNSPPPIYDQEPDMVTKDDALSKETEIDKLMALISLSFNKIYKPTNNNLKTSSNTSRANQDNNPRTNKGTGYDNQRTVNVVGARENVGMQVVQQSRIKCYNFKEFGHVEREMFIRNQNGQRMQLITRRRCYCVKEKARIQLSVEQVDWREDTDDEPEDQELEAYYLYMAKIQEFLKKTHRANPHMYDIGCYNDNLALMLAPEFDETIRLAQEDRLSREYYYADHMNAILGVYTKLDEVTELQCDYLDQVVIGTQVVQQSMIQCFNCKELGHVARECQKPKWAKDANYHKEKMLLCKQEEAGIQLSAKQVDWRDDTDDEPEDQELKAYYLYMVKIREVTPDAAENSGPIFDAEPLQKVQHNDDYNVFAMEKEHLDQPESVNDTYLAD